MAVRSSALHSHKEVTMHVAIGPLVSLIAGILILDHATPAQLHRRDLPDRDRAAGLFDNPGFHLH